MLQLVCFANDWLYPANEHTVVRRLGSCQLQCAFIATAATSAVQPTSFIVRVWLFKSVCQFGLPGTTVHHSLFRRRDFRHQSIILVRLSLRPLSQRATMVPLGEWASGKHPAGTSKAVLNTPTVGLQSRICRMNLLCLLLYIQQLTTAVNAAVTASSHGSVFMLPKGRVVR